MVTTTSIDEANLDVSKTTNQSSAEIRAFGIDRPSASWDGKVGGSPGWPTWTTTSTFRSRRRSATGATTCPTAAAAM